jgi:gliding motility-associated-like protein
MKQVGVVIHIRSLLAAFIIFLSSVAVAQKTTSFSAYATLQFIENKGQWNDKVKFMTGIYNGSLFLQKNGFRVLQHNNDDLMFIHHASHGIIDKHKLNLDSAKKNFTLHSHVYEMQFAGANENVEIIPEKIQTYYNNYFIGNDPSKWASNCRIFEAITYKNIYPGIDARYYSNEGLLKYDLIIHPGASVKDIVMKYDGQTGLEVKNNRLIIKTTVGDVNELEPYSYQYEEGIRQKVDCRFVVEGNTVRFKVGNYKGNEILVIDPTLVFSSFTRSSSDNWGMTATYGPDGSLYAGGIVQSDGFPTTTGAIATTYQGGQYVNLPGDIAIMRFLPNGNNIIYGTYLGGSLNDQPHSLVADAEGNLVIAGRSNSSNYPIVADPGQNLGTRLGYDVIITKINAAGTQILGSIKVGGSGNDGVNIDPDGRETGRSSLMQNYGDDGRSEVIFDQHGNIWLATSSQSSDFPTVNPFQPAKAANQDAVVMRLSNSCRSILFSSFLGGSGDDAAFVLAAQPTSNRIYVAGGTGSNNFPGIKPEVVQPIYGGGIADGFVTIIDADTIVASTYVGSTGIDLLYGIQFDRLGYPYMMGTTTASMPIINAAYGQAGGKQFIRKMEKNLQSIIYQTAYGPAGVSRPNISPTAFLVDRCENVYVSGWGSNLISSYPAPGVLGLPVSPDAGGNYLKNNPGPDVSDFHFLVLKRNAASLLFGCYFGQNGGEFPDHVDGGTSRFDPQGTIYQGICANCGGPANIFPTFPAGAVYGPTNGTANPLSPSIRCNQAAVKIRFDYSGVGSGVQSSINSVVYDTLACIPVTVVFRDTIRNAVYYVWDFGDGSPRDTIQGTIDSVKHVYTISGLYQVMLIAVDENSCNIRDTSYIRIKAGTNKAILGFSYSKLPPCENLTYRFTNTSVSVLARPFSNKAFEWDFGDGSPKLITRKDTLIDHTFPSPGNYNIRLRLLDTSFCNYDEYKDTVLRISTTIKANFQNEDVCVSEAIPLIQNTSQGGAQFYWTVQGDPTVYTTYNLNYNFPAPGPYIITLLIVDTNSCNKRDSITKTVTVRPKPVARFTYTPNTIPAPDNTPTTFINQSTGATKYFWQFGDGDSSRLVNPVHQYQATGTFRPLLTVYNDFGCQDTFSLSVTVLVIPYLDVPNAFSPLSNIGENRSVKVYGFGISKIKWRIFNRWGQLVFEGLTRDAAWDGKYKGQLQPMDVYTYTLEVEYFDGQKVKRSGNITLLR